MRLLRLGGLALSALALALLALAADSAAAARARNPAPVRKAGYWNVSVTTNRSPAPRTRRVCVGAPLFRPRAANCATYSVARIKDAWVLDMDCRSPRGARMLLHSVTTGNLAAKYQTSASVQVSGALDPARNGRRAINVSWSYLGACPKGAAPSAVPVD
ncbi:MAG TPA: hypothetical protein VN694_00930 [Caulobacteraceae bacterium]|nr:hypothetical protein [Caulobacteraceae bacterium]